MSKATLILFSLILFSGIGTAQDTNLLNPDHSAWRFYTDGKATWFYSDLTDYVDIVKPGTNQQLYQTGIKLEPNTNYKLHILAINAFVDREERMSIVVLKHKAPYTVYFRSVVSMPPTYTDAPGFLFPEFTYTFKTPSRIDGDTRFMYLFNYAKAGDNYNMKLSPTLVKVD